MELLAAHAANEQDAVIFRVAAFTGLRLGELRGLRWGDIDWSPARPRSPLVHGRRRAGPPKSGKVRSVPLVDQAARALDELSRRERWTGDDDLVFVNAGRQHIEDSALRRRFYAALDARRPRRTSASTTSATPSGRSRCRRSRSPT